MKSDAKKSPQIDEQEPKASLTAAPVFIFIVLSLFLYWGALYLDKNAGGFNKLVYAPYKSVKELPVPAGDEGKELGRKIYMASCSPCHQANGLGSVGQFPPLAGSEWVLTPGPGRALRIAYNGLKGPITVKGVQWNHEMMAIGQQFGMSDEDLAALLTFVRGNTEWGNTASPVTVEQVKAHRPALDSRTQPWTAEELLQVPEGQ